METSIFPLEEWHPRNLLTPHDFTPHSNKKVWWRCRLGHEWLAAVAKRTNGQGCPFCAGKRPCKENCLATKNSELAKEWDFSLNGNLTPSNITFSSGKKVWWICSKNHKWCASVANRNRSRGCPFCVNKRACLDNCLATLYPALSDEWHSSKNSLSPKSGREVNSSKRIRSRSCRT